MTRKLLLPLVVLILAAGGVAYVKVSRPTALVLTGIVTTNDELRTDIDYHTHTAEGLTSQVKEGEAALRFQLQQTADQISQAEATLASTVAQEKSAEADREN